MIKVTILCHPNNDQEYFNSVLNQIKSSTKKKLNFLFNWKKIEAFNKIDGIKMYAVSEPFKAIDDIINIYDKDEKNKNFRWKVIKNELGYDLSEYNPTEAACLSYLLWAEIAKQEDLDLFFRIEDINSLIKYFRKKDILSNKFVARLKDRKKYFPKNLQMYKDVSFGTLNLLSIYCEKYKYYNHLKDLK